MAIAECDAAACFGFVLRPTRSAVVCHDAQTGDSFPDSSKTESAGLVTSGLKTSAVFCSELVWKLYDRALNIHVGELQPLKDFNLADPVVKVKMRQRYGKRIPLNEPVISPAAMFQSPLLVTVIEK